LQGKGNSADPNVAGYEYGPSNPTPASPDLARAERAETFRQQEQRRAGVYNADQPLDQHPAPAPERIYEPPAHPRPRLRSAVSTSVDRSTTNKLAYDAAKALAKNTGEWVPPQKMFETAADKLNQPKNAPMRFTNPQTGQVEIWQLRNGEPMRLTPRASR
jgi:hypothetical protein